MTKEFADTLMALIEAIIITGAKAPYLYPTPEGGIQAEWSLPDESIEVIIYLSLDGSALFVSTSPVDSQEHQMNAISLSPTIFAHLLREAGVARE